ncbi:MAG: 2Fe-2S iron-sulfur cluster-binding protein, partial [Actinomycetota bacterium]|nr:2Fe-2S iron-sulfur cluster-binding protein [Actinomycetota bacterium]MED5233131.1 2Fe-2S iron-sulfur cluster-binding protein [Actinomycetota bacterium]
MSAEGQDVQITVDGETVAAGPGELLIDACERTGTYIPRFCHHPRMKPVGMCRMCLVEVDTGRGPALQPSCMLPCTPGMVVDTESEGTRKAQDGVLEFLLVNHPLDCPVCDKGGECPLQDQTMAFGPGESRFVEEKRHFEKPIPVNDNVHLDRERCILCDRCTR